ncbi:MAG: hypothetical protein HY735_07550 [Verrucomicrobia bacterium]|nr:hypothetical protein [Verrucomicrobiota bacterium]
MNTPDNAKSTPALPGEAGARTAGPGSSATKRAAKARSAGKPRAKAVAVSADAEKVRIEYSNPLAREVYVAGTFNAWDPRGTSLSAQGEGKWGVELTLPPGCYEYRLVVDGEWKEDPKASSFTPNPYGGLNSVLQVEARA